MEVGGRKLTWKLGPEVEVVSSVRLAFPGVDREADDRHLTPNTQDVKTNLQLHFLATSSIGSICWLTRHLHLARVPKRRAS